MNQHPNHDIQIEIERQALAEGHDRYMRRVEEAAAGGDEASTRPALAFMRRNREVVAKAVDLRLGRTGEPGVNHMSGKMIRDIPSDVIAFHGLRVLLNRMTHGDAFTALAERIGMALRDELTFSTWANGDQKSSYATTQKHIKASTTGQRKRAIASKIMRNEGVAQVAWTPSEIIQIGAFVIDTVVAACDWWSIQVKVQAGKTKRWVVPSAELLAWTEEGNNRVALTQPLRLPMVCPPRPWESAYGGGYLTDLGGQLSLVKTRNQRYLRGLDEVHMPGVYEAINRVQSTPWAVNTQVLDVVRRMWDLGISVGDSLPRQEPEPVPPTPWPGEDTPRVKAEDPERYRAWATEAAGVYERNAKASVKRMAAVEKIMIAERFAEYPEIYFPHQMDYRGRIYPVPHHLTPQGDDLAKGLLRFAEGMPITDRGAWWLKVHIANCFGVDKVSFAERVAWVEKNMDGLLDSALEPVDGDRMWMNADDPIQALAACFELAGYMLEGPTFVSRLSIPMDGSCNGLQNFSALLLDEVGGAETNLIPRAKPADIYTRVSEEVKRQLDQDIAAGNPYAAIWHGRVNRSLVKRPVMTLPYGATLSGMRSQIEEELMSTTPALFPRKDTWAACGYLATVTYAAIGRVVIAARGAMDWLQEVARVVSKCDSPIWWTTPLGFPVLQDYRKKEAKQVWVHIDGARERLILQFDGDKLDKGRQALGISPNFVHSLDSSHMMGTVMIGADNGIQHWSLIHDSYGTHAAMTDVLHACIREAFVEQYSSNLLDKFRQEVTGQLDAEHLADIPEMPPVGKLDLSGVRDSLYFFA